MPETGNPKWIAITRAAIVLGVAAMVGLIFALTYFTVQSAKVRNRIEEEVIQTKKLTEENQMLTEQVRSCIDPKGDCFRKSQSRTAELVGVPAGPINTVNVAASFCAAYIVTNTDRPLVQDDFLTFTHCITERMVTLTRDARLTAR